MRDNSRPSLAQVTSPLAASARPRLSHGFLTALLLALAVCLIVGAGFPRSLTLRGGIAEARLRRAEAGSRPDLRQQGDPTSAVKPPAAPADELSEQDALRRVSLDSAPARRTAAMVRLQPVVWDGEIERRVHAEARLAFARLVAAQAQAAALEGVLPQVRELAVALGRGEEAGDTAGFDRVQADRAVAELEGVAADVAEARARAQMDLAAFFAEPGDARAIRAVPAPAGARAALPEPGVLVYRATAIAREPAPPPAKPASRARAAMSGSDGPAVTARRTELRARVPVLLAIVTERRAALDAFRRAAGAADDFERITHTSYENGIRGALEMVAAHRAVAEARMRLADGALALRRAEIELEELTGEALP